MKNILIFCSENDIESQYREPAQKLASLLAKNGYHLIWGGGNVGLMKVVASTFKAEGSKLTGIIIPVYKQFAFKDIDELIIAESLGERKATMLERSDIVLSLVGGIGTLDELTEIIELKKQKHHNKPIVILNTENFYEGFKMQLEKICNGGCYQGNLQELVVFANTPTEAFDYINTLSQKSN